MLLQPKAEVFAQLTAQTHRRFIKTHTPLDGLPIEDQVTYLCVGRDPRDAAVSMFNHRENMDHEAFLAALHKVIEAEGLETPQISAPPPLSLEASFWNWVADPTPVTQSLSSLRFNLHHAEVALRARARSNVVVMHYGDLKRDCEAEMRGLAKRLGIEVPEPIWPDLVQEASFERMRARAADVAPNSGLNIWKETRQFFHSGSGGHWHAFFDDGARHRYEARVTELSSPEVAAWVHSGWRGTTP